MLGACRGRGEHLLVGASKAEPPERGKTGTVMRREHRLPHAERVHEAHLRQPFERGQTRVTVAPLVRHAGDVAEAEPAVVVRGSDDAVEVELAMVGHVRGAVYPLWG